jgi:hypothetical protein
MVTTFKYDLLSISLITENYEKTENNLRKMKKKIFLVLGVALFGLIALSTVAAAAPTNDTPNYSNYAIGVSWWGSGGGDTGTGPDIDESDLQVGDLICQTGKYDWLIPGRYSHVQIYIGGGQVVEADPDNGVNYSPVTDGDVYRVSTSWSIKQDAADWAEDKVGLSYDFWLVSKQINGNSYYCSELCWGAYLSAGGPDIDQNPGWSWTYANGVAPTECADDSDTSLVGTL